MAESQAGSFARNEEVEVKNFLLNAVAMTKKRSI
jgi:hypothetical protein